MRLRHLAAPPLLLARRLFKAKPGLRILLLHDVPAHDLDALDALVGRLARTGRLTDPAAAAAMLAGERPISGHPCLITFDDGFISNLAAAETVLARHSAKALFFVCPGLMALPVEDQREAIAARVFDGKRHAHELPADMRLMDWSELARLRAAGHVIGNHTLNHRRLNTLSDGDMAREIAGGAEMIAARLAPAEWFAFPFGDIDSVDPRVLAEAGRHHRFCRSGVRGLNDGATSPLAVLADHVDLGDPPAFQQLVAEGGLDRRYAAARARLTAMAEEPRS